MEESNKERSPEEDKQPQPLHRRKLLKIMATTTGAAGVSLLLPAKWTKPLCDVIVLPAHAQTSGDDTLVISDFTIDSVRRTIDGKSLPGNSTVKAPSASGTPHAPTLPLPYYGEFNHSDSNCAVTPKYTRVEYSISGGGQLNFKTGTTIAAIPGTVCGTPCSGYIGFGFDTNDGEGKTLNINLNIENRFSNVISQTIPYKNGTYF